MRRTREGVGRVPHVRPSVRGPKMICFECSPYRVPVCSINQNDRRAAPVLFGPCTLGRGAPVLLRWVYSLVFVVIFWMVLVVLMPLTVGTISTRPPQVVISSAPTMLAAV
jgi:hypothetical protein